MVDKGELRKAARARRRSLAAELDTAGARQAAGQRIADAVLALLSASEGDPGPGPTRPRRVATYESLPVEPPTGPLITALLAAGHEVIVPITLPDYSLEWTYAAEGTVGGVATITRSVVGPDRTVLGPDALAGCDLIITPGLSVDPRGMRLGQGGGCYDRALIHRNPAAPVITLLFEGEASADPLPADAHDQPVDGFLTTAGEFVPVGSPEPEPAPAPLRE